MLTSERTWSALLSALTIAGLMVPVEATVANADDTEVRPPYDLLEQFEGPVPRLIESTSYMRATEARQLYQVDGTGLTAAVLDSGLRTTHVDFAGKVLAQKNYTSNNGGNPNNANDGHGHGTNVAGIICANDQHTGFAPGANVIPMKVLSNAGSGSWAWSAEALDWVIANAATYNISVVNMSLGGAVNYQSEPNESGLELRSRVQQLRSMRIPVVIAAGNAFYSNSSQEGMSYPAIIRESVSVGAIYDANIGGPIVYGDGATAYTTQAGRITPFSQRLHQSTNSSTRTDIFCTGAALTSSGILTNTSSSTMHGTSQAAPSVAGLILLAQHFHRRETGQLPTVDKLEGWLRSSGVANVDGDDENDNVTNTGKTFLQADALNLLNLIADELGVDPPPPPCDCPLDCMVQSAQSALDGLIPSWEGWELPLTGLLGAVRTFRDDVLKSTPEGRQLVAAYYSHGRELSSLMLRNPQLMREALNLVHDLRPALGQAGESGTAQVSERDWERGWQLIGQIREHASSELAAELDNLRSFLDERRTGKQGEILITLGNPADRFPGSRPREARIPATAGFWPLVLIGSLWGGQTLVRRRRRPAP